MEDEGLTSFGTGTGHAELSEGLFAPPEAAFREVGKATPVDTERSTEGDGGEGEEEEKKKRTRSRGKRNKKKR